MRIAVLSGKGGTGKTFISVNLADVMEECSYIDCDVEEPNGHLFLQPDWLETRYVTRKLPVVDQEKCTGCRICTDFCKFNALAFIADKVLVFDEVCHSCGGCELVCAEDAISEIEKEIGKIQYGISHNTKVYTGTMLVNEASGVPIINQLLKTVKDNKRVVIDCPPGSACTVMESIKDVDYCVLVAEPTIFGRHNLAMVHELVKIYNKPYGVVLNKCIDEGNPSKEFCEENNMNILGEIAYNNQLANLLSEGKIPVREDKTYRKHFLNILNNIYLHFRHTEYKEVPHETNTYS